MGQLYDARMLDIKVLRERSDDVRTRLAARGSGEEKAIDLMLQHDETRRKALFELETLKSQRKRISTEIGALKSQKKNQEAEIKKQETRAMGEPEVQIGIR